jgi:hypothetical protein
MDFLDQISRIEFIDKKIRLNTAGKPSDLAKEIQLSQSQLFLVLQTMKKLGAPLNYSRKNQCYSYTSSKRFICGFIDE